MVENSSINKSGEVDTVVTANKPALTAKPTVVVKASGSTVNDIKVGEVSQKPVTTSSTSRPETAPPVRTVTLDQLKETLATAKDKATQAATQVAATAVENGPSMLIAAGVIGLILFIIYIVKK